MKKFRIILLFVCLLSLTYFFFTPKVISAGKEYPYKPINFLVPRGAGGASDIASRKLGQLVSGYLGQEVIIVNKEGAGGLVAASFLAKSEADGYTIGGITATTFTLAPFTQKMDFDPLTAFVPIIQIFTANQILIAMIDSPVNTFKDFIEEGRKRRLLISTGAGGLMSPTIISLQRLIDETKINAKIVPFNSVAEGVTALLGGQTEFFLGGGFFEFVRAGKVKTIVAFTKETKQVYKEIPTLEDFGYDLSPESFLAVFAPKGVPEPIRKKLEEVFTRAHHDPSVRETISKMGESPFFLNSKDLDKFIRERHEKNKKIFQELKLGIYSEGKK